MLIFGLGVSCEYKRPSRKKNDKMENLEGGMQR
jgi:hypothetical protein